MAEGNRKDPRARVLNMTVRYKSATVDEFIENHSHDISKGGIFIKTRAPFPAGTLLKFEVRIAEDQRLMQGVGRVVWRREPERAEEGFPAGMGIKFIKTGEGAAELIAQIISAREGQESSFDAGVRETGLDVDSARRPAAAAAATAAAVEASEPPAPDAPVLQVESGPLSMPVDGEFRVSSPPKKRQGQVSETRKVVLQGAAFGAPSSDKTPVSTPARVVAAQALDERAPSRQAPPAKERSSIVDETTAPRARSSGDPHSARSKEERQSGNPSVFGLVAILGAIGLTVFLVNRIRGPEAEAPAPAATAATTPAPAASVPPAPLAAPPTLPAPPPEAGEGALPAQVGATATAPSTSLGMAPSAALGTPAAAGSGTASGAPSAAATPPPVPPVAAAPVTGAKAVAPSVAAKPAAPSPPAAAKPKPAAAAAATATAKPPAAPKPKPEATVVEKGAGEASIRPAGEPEPAPPAGSTAPAATTGTKTAETPKKSPPAATTPAEPEPAPSPPKTAPSDDNPY
jgi:uncharacterized protein (TIGR02266 family)